MNYEEFLEYIKENITKYLVDEKSYLVELIKSVKNNGLVLDGLTIREQEEGLSPIIYLNDYYSKYQTGTSMGVILDNIAKCYYKSLCETSVNLYDIRNFEAVRDKIVLRLVNYEKNREQLKGCPHKKYLDLAVTFRYMASKDDGIATALVSNEMYACWDIELEDLYQIALFNTMREFPWQIDDLAKTIMNLAKDAGALSEDMIVDTEEMEKTESSLDMYVLSNASGINGATSILYENVVKNFAGIQKTNLFLLPSSIHEMVVMPERDDTEPEFLAGLVAEANQSAVGLADWLSDNIYYYDREKDQISIYEQTAISEV